MDAAAVLRGGELLEAIKRCFSPSNQTGGPTTVVAIRVNPATRASLNLERINSSQTAIALVSTDWGLYNNQIKVKIEDGTSIGKKLTTQLGQNYYSQDNVGRQVLQVRYKGSLSAATITITNTNLVATLTGPITITVDFATYNTIQKVADYLSSFQDVTAVVLGGFSDHPTLNALDGVSGQDVKTAPYIVTAHLQACVDWFNSVGEGFVTATRDPGATVVPKNIGFTYLAGGSDGTITNTDWSNAFTTLQLEDVQWVTPISGSASIHAMADAHVQFMSTVGRMERRAICGMASGSSDAAALSAAFALNSDRTSLMHIGPYDYDSSGALKLYPPYIAAAMAAAMFAGTNPGTPLTNKTMAVRGWERYLRNPTDTDTLINGGVMCVEKTGTGYKIVKSISTWLVNDNYNRVEQSTGAALDFTVRNIRDALDVLRGEKNNPQLLSRAVSIVDSKCRELARPEPTGPGVLAGDDDSPAYKNIRATIEGDVLRVELQASPVIPCNYALLTVFAVPFTGSASAAVSL